jgi:hypothetical protein
VIVVAVVVAPSLTLIATTAVLPLFLVIGAMVTLRIAPRPANEMLAIVREFPRPGKIIGATEDPGTRTRIGPIMRLPGVTLRLGHSGRRPALVIRVEGGERLALGPVTAAALLAAAILCAADAPPTLGGVSIVGYGLLAVALWLLVRLTAPRVRLSAERRDRPS